MEDKEKEQSVGEKLNQLIDQNKKIEQLITPLKDVKSKKLSKNLQKKGYVNYIYIRENGEMEEKQLPIEEATTMIEKAPRLGTPVHILHKKGVPTIIQPSWSCEPFSPALNFDQTKRDGMLSAGFQLLTNRQELGEVKPKKSMSGMTILLIVAVLGILGYFIFK